MSFLHQWDYKYLCELEQRKTMKEDTYWNTTSTYGDDYEIIYFITE